MIKKYDLAVAYRVYPGVSKDPVIYKDNKFKMVELCATSLSVALKQINPHIFFILDNCPKYYEDFFRESFKDFDFEFIHYNGIGNQATFNRQINYLLEQNYSDKIMFAEDDYFFLPNCFSEMMNFWENNNDIDFLSPYDHSDIGNTILHSYSCDTIQNNDFVWRTSGATTLTFLTSKEILAQTEMLFKTYIYKNFDTSMWLTLTGKNQFNLNTMLKAIKEDPVNFKVFAKQFIYTPFWTLFGKRYNLWSPVPSLSTHMESTVLAPGLNWFEEFEKFKNTYLL